MKNVSGISGVIIFTLATLLFSCKNENVPTVTTAAVTNITGTTATSGGTIVFKRSGKIISKGVCWSTGISPTVADTKTIEGGGFGNFLSEITGLKEATVYYVRAYATNSAGTGYGMAMSFTTSSPTVTDMDGNIYQTVIIGYQTWMAENLKTTKYNDGTSIPLITINEEWSKLTTPGYCWYNNEEATYKNTYGALYNWYAVNTGKLCPTGWHVPTMYEEWETLIIYLGGHRIAGGKLKEAGLDHWTRLNTGSTNETGFTALPGGIRNHDGTYLEIGVGGYWWSSTEADLTHAWGRDLLCAGPSTGEVFEYKRSSYSVRCIKDSVDAYVKVPEKVEINPDENPLTQYKQSLPPSEGYIAVLNKDGKWGYVNNDGKVRIECHYEGVSSFKNGKAVVKISSEEDWQTTYHYIDANGNDLGLFFRQIDGTSCDEATVAISDILVQTDFLRNCPDGVMSVYYEGDEGSSGVTFYPNVNIEQLIAKLAKTDNEFGPFYKKFDGSSLEFKDGDFNMYITVNKDAEGIVTSINFSRNYHSMGAHKTFTPKGTGVMVSEGTGA